MEKKLLPFKSLELSDRDWVMEKFRQSDFRGCEYSFGNNFIWRRQYNMEVADYKGFLLARSKYKNKAAYSYPAGDGDLKEVIKELIMDSCCRGIPFELRGVTEENLAKINAMFPDVFDYFNDRDDSDYIYLTEKLSTLSGKKLQSKRNHISRFKDNPNWSYEPVSADNIEECMVFNKNWCDENGCMNDPDLQLELCAVNQAFEYFFKLKLDGGILRRNGEIIAYSMGEPLNSDTYVVHIEKAYHHIQGAYPMINQQFVLANCGGFKYINREEDMGTEGLRKAKLSYHPEILFSKYRLTLKGRVGHDNLCKFTDGCTAEKDLERVLR